LKAQVEQGAQQIATRMGYSLLGLGTVCWSKAGTPLPKKAISSMIADTLLGT
jgi:hypothetical protein